MAKTSGTPLDPAIRRVRIDSNVGSAFCGPYRTMLKNGPQKRTLQNLGRK
jgi:hypothetical protein